MSGAVGVSATRLSPAAITSRRVFEAVPSPSHNSSGLVIGRARQVGRPGLHRLRAHHPPGRGRGPKKTFAPGAAGFTGPGCPSPACAPGKRGAPSKGTVNRAVHRRIVLRCEPRRQPDDCNCRAADRGINAWRRTPELRVPGVGYDVVLEGVPALCGRVASRFWALRRNSHATARGQACAVWFRGAWPCKRAIRKSLPRTDDPVRNGRRNLTGLDNR